MTSSGEGRGAGGEGSGRESVSPKPLATRLLSFACASTALVLISLTFFDWDIPLTRFVRSLNDFQIDHLANPWLARLSDSGDRLGKGESLLVLSLVIVGVGYGLKHSVWKAAGWQSLIAHGLAAAISNVLKYAVGRPRPKFMHAGTHELTPIGGSGWDSFPSGHAMASCAVAMVLAIRFPKAKWAIMIVALAVMTSRVLRGAHYLTDVASGAFLGCLLGAVAASPWREWRMSLVTALRQLMPVVAGLFVALWTVLQIPPDTGLFHAFVISGSVLTLGGLVTHVAWTRNASFFTTMVTGALIKEIIGLGLAMTTGSQWVTLVVLFVCLARWLDRYGDDRERRPLQGQATPSLLLREGLFVGAVLLALLGSYSVKGIVPLP